MLTVRAIRPGEMEAAWQVIRQLRTQLTPKLFAERLSRQSKAGYRLFGAFDPDLVGLLGMRPVETLARGHHLHVDDLVVTEARRGYGIGRRLLSFAEEEARKQQMTSVFLDSRPEVLDFYGKLGYRPHTATLVRKVLEPPLDQHGPPP